MAIVAKFTRHIISRRIAGPLQSFKPGILVGKAMHTDDTNDVIAFVLVQDMSRIIQLKPYCFEVVRLNIKDF